MFRDDYKRLTLSVCLHHPLYSERLQGKFTSATSYCSTTTAHQGHLQSIIVIDFEIAQHILQIAQIDKSRITISLCRRDMRAGVKCRVRDSGCGEMPTHKIRGKVQGLTPQFTCTNAPWPHDDHEPGDAWAWDNRCYVTKHQLRFSEAHKVT